ncbi:MAG: TIM barrel protein, partial [Flavihumibacter sp.]
MKRRIFLRNTLLGAGALAAEPLAFACTPAAKLKISLAEWSLHRTLKAGQLNHLDFPLKAKKDYGVDAVEYVSTFFGLGRNMTQQEAAKNNDYLKELLQRSKDAGVYNNLIMVDAEGPLAIPDETERLQAVDNHKKWVDAASLLGCTIIRVNLQGEGDRDAKKTASVDSLSRLGEYAASQNISVVVENHGGDSSRADWLVSIMQQVNRKNVGTLPDFGNFCISKGWGTTQGGCTEAYDRYKGVAE